MRSLLIVATFQIIGCDPPCHGWDEIELVDNTGQDDGEGLEAIRGAIDTFSSWTGREESCVGKVTVKQELEHRGEPISGQYRGPTHKVLVEHREDSWAMADTTVHELCHAVDHEEGWISLTLAETLEPYTEGLNEVLYATDDERTVEAFARVCDDGPVLHPLWRQLEEACGEELVDDAYERVHELLYGQRDSTMELGRFAGSTLSSEVSGVDDLELRHDDHFYTMPMVGGAEGLFVLDLLSVEDEDGKWQVAQPVLRRLDPSSARQLEQLEVDPIEELIPDPNGNPYLFTHQLLGSSGDPILYHRGQPGTAWRVLSDPLRLEAVAFPTLAVGDTVRGFEHEGRLLVHIETVEGASIATTELGGEAWTPLALDEEDRLEGLEIRTFDVDDQGATLLLSGGGGLTLAGMSWEGEIEWFQDLGCAGCSALNLSRLSDGSALVTTSVSTVGFERAQFALRYDPVEGSFSTPDGECNSWRYYLSTVHWEDEQWQLWLPDDGEGNAGPMTLLRLDIEPI